MQAVIWAANQIRKGSTPESYDGAIRRKEEFVQSLVSHFRGASPSLQESWDSYKRRTEKDIRGRAKREVDSSDTFASAKNDPSQADLGTLFEGPKKQKDVAGQRDMFDSTFDEPVAMPKKAKPIQDGQDQADLFASDNKLHSA